MSTESADQSLTLPTGDDTGSPALKAQWQWHPDVYVACRFCGAMSHARCPAGTCGDCGSTATVMMVDEKDNAKVRRCLRCDAVAVW